MTVFVLCSQQRSGAGALASFIASHSEIDNVGEVLNPHDWELPNNFFSYWLSRDPAALIRSGKSPSDAFISYLDDLEATHADGHVLLDLTLNSIRNVLNYWEELSGFTEAGLPWLLRVLSLRNYPVIYLHRENHLHRYVSSQLVEMTGVYRSSDPQMTGVGSLEIDVDHMRDFILRGEASHEAFLRYLSQFNRSLILTYNEAFSGGTVRGDAKIALAKFCGLRLKLDAESYYVKLRTTRLEKTIINLDEVREALTRLDRLHYLEP